MNNDSKTKFLRARSSHLSLASNFDRFKKTILFFDRCTLKMCYNFRLVSVFFFSTFDLKFLMQHAWLFIWNIKMSKNDKKNSFQKFLIKMSQRLLNHKQCTVIRIHNYLPPSFWNRMIWRLFQINKLLFYFYFKS